MLAFKEMLSKINPFATTSVTTVPETMSHGFTRDRSDNFADFSFSNDSFGGETMPDMFGLKRNFNHIGSIDYYQLRTLSIQLDTENMYANGIIGRMETNVINQGLKLNANPEEVITGFNDDEQVEWSKKTEALFALWSASKTVSVDEVNDLSGLEKVGYRSAMIEGDILKITEIDKKTGLPRIKYINGRHIQTAINSEKLADKGNKVIYGVEVNKKSGKHIAFHVVQDNELGIQFDAVRILAKGRTSNRDTATLIYNKPPPPGVTRGYPLLSRILQPLAQIGRYATLELKAAEINAALAQWVEKTEEVKGSNPLGGATLKSEADTVDPNAVVEEGLPKQRVQGGTIVNELAFGEKIHSFDTKRPNTNFTAFEKGILQRIAMSIGMPPEVFLLMFENSFSASRQATIEFRSVVLRERDYFSKQFNKDVYGQWLSGMVLNDKIQAKGYILALKTGDVFGIEGWRKSSFKGFIKQNVDILKEAKAYKEYIDEGLLTRDQAANDLTGADFLTNVKRLKKENEKLADARDPLLGEINTSISRVEKDKVNEPKPKTEPKPPAQPAPRKSAAKISGFNQKTTLAIMNLLAGLEEENQSIDALEESVDDDVEAVDIEIDEMDKEKEE